MKYRKVKQVLSCSGYHWEGGRHKERVKEDKYGGCSLHFYLKIEE
jgi:hypothetical protein